MGITHSYLNVASKKPTAAEIEIGELVPNFIDNQLWTKNTSGNVIPMGVGSLAAYAPLASPALTGTPTAPTAAANTDTTQIATTAFVQQEMSSNGGVGINNTFEFVATASQTTFSGADTNANTLSYTPGNIYVIVDGFHISTNDYTASNGTSITFTTGLSLNQELSIISFEEFDLAQPDTTMPLGSIIAIASNLSGSHTIPGTGVVDATGWMYCDGSTIPASQALSGTLPDLTDGRFLRGSTSSGTTGGGDSFVLASTQMPVHTHTGPSHYHTGPSHRHTITHDHGSFTSGSHAGHSHPRKNGYYQNSDFYDASTAYGNNGTFAASTSGRSGGVHTHSVNPPSFSGYSGYAGTGVTAYAGTGATGSAGLGVAVSHIPKFVTVQYMIKVN